MSWRYDQLRQYVADLHNAATQIQDQGNFLRNNVGYIFLDTDTWSGGKASAAWQEKWMAYHFYRHHGTDVLTNIAETLSSFLDSLDPLYDLQRKIAAAGVVGVIATVAAVVELGLDPVADGVAAGSDGTDAALSSQLSTKLIALDADTSVAFDSLGSEMLTVTQDENLATTEFGEGASGFSGASIPDQPSFSQISLGNSDQYPPLSSTGKALITDLEQDPNVAVEYGSGDANDYLTYRQSRGLTFAKSSADSPDSVVVYLRSDSSDSTVLEEWYHVQRAAGTDYARPGYQPNDLRITMEDVEAKMTFTEASQRGLVQTNTYEQNELSTVMNNDLQTLHDSGIDYYPSSGQWLNQGADGKLSLSTQTPGTWYKLESDGIYERWD